MFLNDRYKNGFTTTASNKNFKFYKGCDDEESYLKHCEIKSKDWYYYNNPIDYNINSFGFRCNDIEFLEDDYLLFTGCSYTEGVGLHLENTYPYIVAKKLNKTYYNLALGGTGPDIVKHNLIMFLSYMHKIKLPKYIIIQWPDFSRFTFFDKNFQNCHINPYNNLSNLFRELVENELLENTNRFNIYSTLEFIKNMGIEHVIELGYPSNDNYIRTFSKKIKSQFWVSANKFEKARDLAHPGIEPHKILSEEILDAIKTM